MVPEQRIFSLPQCYTKSEKRTQGSRNSENDRKGRNRHNQQRKKKKTRMAVLAVKVTTNITHINIQQTNPLKMIKKNGLHQLKLRKRKGEKSDHFFVK